MNCDEARAAFTDLYDGSLTGLPLTTLSQHVDGCPDCRREWAAFRHTMQALKGLADAEPAPGFAARVVDRIEAPRWWEGMARALVLPLRVKLPMHATALALLCLAGLWLLQESPEIQKAADLRKAASVDAPTATPPPASAPPRAQQAEPAPRPAEAPPQTRAIQPPSSPPAPVPDRQREAPAPSVEGKIEAPVIARDSAKVAQAPAMPDKAPFPAAPMPSAEGRRTESEIAAAPPRLRSAQAPSEYRERAQPTPPAGPGAAATTGGLSAPSRGTADEIFSTAATAFAAQQYESTVDALRAFLVQYPKDTRAPDARFLLADAYRALGRHAEARTEYEVFLRQYPNHRNAPTASYRLAEVALLLGDPSGCAMLRDALRRHPDAREAQPARDILSSRCP